MFYVFYLQSLRCQRQNGDHEEKPGWPQRDRSGLKSDQELLELFILFILKSQDAFIVDAVSGGLFIWIGKDCTLDERKKAMEWGQEYLKKQVNNF